jgi:hypothetical protein
MPFDNPYQTPFGDVELLWDTRRRIASRGDWVQGRFQDGNRRCLVAALSIAAGSQRFDMPNRLERRLARLLATELPPISFWARMNLFTCRQRLMRFNDDTGTRHEDVMALFDRTIGRLTNADVVSISASLSKAR